MNDFDKAHKNFFFLSWVLIAASVAFFAFLAIINEIIRYMLLITFTGFAILAVLAWIYIKKEIKKGR